MSLVESAFVQYQPQLQTMSSNNFHFLAYDPNSPNGPNGSHRRTIRSVASKVSADDRIASTKRNQALSGKRTHSNAGIKKSPRSPIKRELLNSPKYSTPKQRKQLYDLVIDTSPISPIRFASSALQTVVSTPSAVSSPSYVSTPSPQLPVAFDAWTCNMTTLIAEYWGHAVLELRRRPIGCDLVSLSALFAEPMLYNEPLMLSCLELLATSAPNASGSRLNVSQRLIDSLWERVWTDVLQETTNWARDPVLVLLAGWRISSANKKDGGSILNYLSYTPYSAAPYMVDYTASIPEERLIHCMPQPLSPIAPKGFEFYRVNDLLPLCLMDVCSKLSPVDLSNPAYLSNMRRIGSAAMACQSNFPQTGRPISKEHKMTHHVRLATALVAHMAQVDNNTDNEFVIDHDPASSALVQLLYDETINLDSSSLIGLVYDQVLLWTLCVFAAAAYDGQAAAPQRAAIKTLLRENAIYNWATLENLLGTYYWSYYLNKRLQFVIGDILPNKYSQMSLPILASQPVPWIQSRL